MIIVKMMGGLGNQLFEYAAGRRMALAKGVPLKLDLISYEYDQLRRFELDRFNIQAEPATRLELALLRSRGRFHRGLHLHTNPHLPERLRWAYDEKHLFEFDPAYLRVGRHAYLFGMWQSYHYLEPIDALLRRELTLKQAPDAQNQAVIQQIASANAVSLHIRRSDYTTPSADWLGLLPLGYYERAVQYIADTVASPHFFVFSDEPDWARAHLHPGYPTTYVDHNDTDHAYEDLRLMSQCRHHIIANSSFSWWGAWLGHSPEQRVVAPTPWCQNSEHPVKDLYPPAWHLIETKPG